MISCPQHVVLWVSLCLYPPASPPNMLQGIPNALKGPGAHETKCHHTMDLVIGAHLLK